MEQLLKFNFALYDKELKEDYILLMKNILKNYQFLDIQDFIPNHKDLFNELNINFNNLNIENKNDFKNNIKIYTFFDIDLKDCIICLKRDLLLKKLSIFFSNVYFYDKYFNILYLSFDKNYYKKKEFSNNKTVYDNDIHLSFPSRIKNFSNSSLFLPKIFLTPNSKFFESETFEISHPYFTFKHLKKSKPIISHYFPINSEGLLFYGNNIYYPNEIIYSIDCELINNKDTIFGNLKITKRYLIFQSKNDFSQYNTELDYVLSTGESDLTKREKQIIIKYKEIEEIIKRRFLFLYQAIEIFLLNGKSYFFNLLKIEKANNFMIKIKEIKIEKSLNFNIIENPKEKIEKDKIKRKWDKREINTFQFLLYINKYAGRTYNDINQYPIFPWIILNIYENGNKYENKYRNFILPISIQNKPQREFAKTNFIFSKDDNPNFPFHFRLHYSNGAYVSLYLERLSPFTDYQIKLQKNKFDSPDRQFSSYGELISVLLNNNDNRELIPDLFYTFEYFYNLNYNFFGKRVSDQQIVNNIEIPYSFKSPAEFVYYMRYIINEDEIKDMINEWIDNIFGINQYESKPKIDNLNTFNPLSYSQNVKFMDILNNKDINETEKKTLILDQKSIILLFGQTPEQVFNQSSKYIIRDNNEEKFSDDVLDNFSEFHKLKKKINITENEIIYFYAYKKENKEFFYFLIKDKSKKEKSYSINVWEYLTEFKCKKSINISSIKLYRKKNEIKVNSNDKNIFYIYKLNPKYIMFEILNCQIFIVGRNEDNTLKIYGDTKFKYPKSIQTDSFISSLLKIDEENFISGHLNGRILIWEIKKINQNINLKIKRDIFAHNDSMICSMNYIKNHNIIITSSEDGHLFIRKYYDFELLNVIKLNKNEFVNDILFSNFDMFYFLNFNKIKMKFSFDIYSINGLKAFEDSHYLYIDNFACISNGIIIFTLSNSNDIYYYSLFDNIIQKYKFEEEDEFCFFKINKCIYYEEERLIYILYDNGDLIRKVENKLNNILLTKIVRKINTNK